MQDAIVIGAGKTVMNLRWDLPMKILIWSGAECH